MTTKESLSLNNFLPMFCLSAVLLLSSTCFSSTAIADSINYCHDEETNRQWEKLAHNNSEPEYKELYRLRKDLCTKVDKGDIELDAAIDLFEKARQEKVEILRQKIQQREESLPVAG